MAITLTSTGITRDTLQETIEGIEKDLQDAFGNPSISAEDDENLGNLIKVLANRENLACQAIEQLWSYSTLNGAEGAFLDEIFALNGTFRQTATASSGFAVVETDSGADNTTAIEAGTIFGTTTDKSYANTTEASVSERVCAYSLTGSDISIGSYSFSVTNRSTDEEYNTIIALAESTSTARLSFLTTLQTFLQSVNTDESNIYLDETNVVLYYGFDSAYELVGLEQNINLEITPSLGNRFTLVEVTATETGYNYLRAGEVISISPLPTGYVSITNLDVFSTGSEIETDAAFIERAQATSDSPSSSTRPAIISALLDNVDGVESVKINKEVIDGVVYVTPIVIGGEGQDIAEELYLKQPIDCIFSGELSYTVTTSDGDPETVYFTRGTETPLSVKITYITTNGTTFTDTEQDDIITNLTDLAEEWSMGSKIYNAQLTAAIYNAVDYNRLTSLVVQVKLLDDDVTAYTSSDYESGSSELPSLVEDNIVFVRTS